jgi:hypothetical protein
VALSRAPSGAVDHSTRKGLLRSIPADRRLVPHNAAGGKGDRGFDKVTQPRICRSACSEDAALSEAHFPQGHLGRAEAPGGNRRPATALH